MKYVYTIFRVNYKTNTYEPFAIATCKKQAIRRIQALNRGIEKSRETFFQLVRIWVENGGYFNEGKILKIEE